MFKSADTMMMTDRTPPITETVSVHTLVAEVKPESIREVQLL